MEVRQLVVEKQIKVHRKIVEEKNNKLSEKEIFSFGKFYLIYIHNDNNISFVMLDENFSNDENIDLLEDFLKYEDIQVDMDQHN